MCGLIAAVASRFAAQVPDVLHGLKDRGPDRQAVEMLGDATLAHARLAVLDLRTGDQPMHTSDRRLSVVYNGEIYNFAELRRDLEQAGAQFHTRSDTEVLLHAYAIWGDTFVRRLDGMFAFAIWDTSRQRLFCARDRTGIKPLFYSTHDGLFVSSTLTPFLKLRGFPRQLDYQGLRDYLAFQTFLSPRSMLTEVRQLEPASTLAYDVATRTCSIETYWRPPEAIIYAGDAELVERAESLLRDSVRAQRVADVPLGAFLSGGIDSSLIVHYLASYGTDALRTYSVRFADQGYDESGAALAVASKYGTRHEVFDAPSISAASVADAIADLDQPLADPAYLPLTQVAGLARQSVTVALGGDGADELFGGYSRYQVRESDFASTWKTKALAYGIRAGLLPAALTRQSLSGFDALLFRHVELGPWEAGRKSMAQYLRPEIASQFRTDDTLRKWIDLCRESGNPVNSRDLMRADLWTYLSDNCLAKADRASMRHSLEIRVPFLSNAMLDFALTAPTDMHFLDGSKTLLKRLAKRHLPSEVWDRPKHGFSVPLAQYFGGPWRDLVLGVASECSSIAPFLNPDKTRRCLEAAVRGKGSMRLAYTLLVLLMWLRSQDRALV